MEIKENKPKSLYGLIILILGFLVISAGGCLYFLSLNENEKNKANDNEGKLDNNGNQNSDDIISLDINDELVVRLYSYIDKEYSNAQQEELSYYPYRTEKVNYDKLSKTYIARMVMKEVNQDTKGIKFSLEKNDGDLLYSSIPISKFNHILKEKFGNVLDFKTDDLREALDGGQVYTGSLEYDNYFGMLLCSPFFNMKIGVIGNEIVCAEFRGGGVLVGRKNYTEIVKVEKDNNNVYIYDKFLAERDDIYYISSTEVLEVEENVNDIFEKYFDKLHTFKHTFTKDSNGNYYYVSSEMVK